MTIERITEHVFEPEPRKRKRRSFKDHKISRILREQGKSCEEFEVFLNRLTLEELIALKLELATQPLKRRLYGIPIYNFAYNIVKHAIVLYVITVAESFNEACLMLGISRRQLMGYTFWHGISNYFKLKNIANMNPLDKKKFHSYTF